MPRRWYYSVTVKDRDGKKTTYTNAAADQIIQYIADSKLEPEQKSPKVPPSTVTEIGN